MSSEAREWAWRQDVSGGAKLLLLALAERADLYGVAWIGRQHASEMTGQSPKTVTENMKRLEAGGLIERFRRTRENGSRTSDWTVLAARSVDRGRMEDDPGGRGDDVADAARRGLGEETTGVVSADLGEVLGGTRTNSRTNSKREGTRARGPLRVGGRAVNADVWQRTEAVLAIYNEEFGQSLKLLDGAGAPSAAAKQIYLRVKEHPEIDVAGAWRDIIRRTRTSEWWDGEPGFGVVFGPKVFEKNITCSGEPVRRRNRRPAEAPSGHREGSPAWKAQAAAHIRAMEERQAREGEEIDRQRAAMKAEMGERTNGNG